MITIAGAGPAGAAAAIAALGAGASVTLYDRARFPRHKVCGEFLSPEIEPRLRALGVADAFQALAPARVRRMELHFGSRYTAAPLSDPGFGLSRHAFDQLLLSRALALGADWRHEVAPERVLVDTTGRPKSSAAKGDRLFGFKAHFEGPANDAVELYFAGRGYVGVNAIEGGRTNVCGLAPESDLRRFDFDYDGYTASLGALAERLRPLRRCLDWLSTGPLEVRNRLDAPAGCYPAGDALSFVDPFTGSGLLCAVTTGTLAGRAAARNEDPARYLADCRAAIGRPFLAASLLREGLWRLPGLADRLAPLLPARWLFRLTRPRVA